MLLLSFTCAGASAYSASSSEPYVSTPPGESKHVLILLQEDMTWPIFRQLYENARDTLRIAEPGILVYSEHMDRLHFPDPRIQSQRAAWIRQKYANTKLDLVIAAGDVPIDLFPGVPLLYVGMSSQPELHARLASIQNSAGLWVSCDVLKTVDLARQLHPKARQLLFIAGGSAAEKPLTDEVHRQLSTYLGLTIIDLSSLSLDEILARVATLGPESIVLFSSWGSDKDGHTFISADVASRIAVVSSAPTYVLLGTHLGNGTVGGYVTRFDEMGKQAGEMGIQMLSGGHPEDAIGKNSYVFDSRTMQRWKLEESSLPVGTVILNRQPSLWESYKLYILGAVLLCCLQALLIVGLLWQRSKKRIFQQSLLAQMAFEKMLSDLSTAFINLPQDQIGSTIEVCLGRIAKFLNVDRITLFDDSDTELITSFSWHAEDIPPLPQVMKIDGLPWWNTRFVHTGMFTVSDVATLPEEAATEREHFRKFGTTSIAIFPLKSGEDSFGCISFSSVRRRVEWTEELTDQLKLLAEIFSNALGRKRAQEARLRHTAIVQSSDDAIISKDLNGIILSWNAGAERIFEYSPEEAVGRSIGMLVPPDLQDEEKYILERIKAGVHVEHYETTRITKHKKRIFVSLTISPVRDSSGLIVGAAKIARDITDRKRAEQVLSESEERFRLVANNAPALIWMADADRQFTFVNQGWLNFTGRPLQEELGNGWVYAVHPDDRDRTLEQYANAFDARVDFEREYRLRRHDGEYRWIVDFGVPRFERDGTFCGYIGSCIDITERKTSEETLHNLSGRLIRAQEEERARIARELHDDFSQRLAILGIGLGQLWKKLPESDVEQRSKVLEILKIAKEISSDIHTLSHQLHSSKLEHVGVSPALRGLCKEIGDKYGIDVVFSESGFPCSVPKDIALCLFRIAQESLNNAVKHSHAHRVTVDLTATDGLVRLRVCDSGSGFDLDAPSSNLGIGLIGMSERVRLVGGKFTIDTGANKGTEILAEVPLAVSTSELRAKIQVAGD